MRESCPKCGSIFIQFNGRQYECLELGCQHKWTKWLGGPRTYGELENPHLIASLSCSDPNSLIPFAEEE